MLAAAFDFVALAHIPSRANAFYFGEGLYHGTGLAVCRGVFAGRAAASSLEVAVWGQAAAAILHILHARALHKRLHCGSLV